MAKNMAVRIFFISVCGDYAGGLYCIGAGTERYPVGGDANGEGVCHIACDKIGGLGGEYIVMVGEAQGRGAKMEVDRGEIVEREIRAPPGGMHQPGAVAEINLIVEFAVVGRKEHAAYGEHGRIAGREGYA